MVIINYNDPSNNHCHACFLDVRTNYNGPSTNRCHACFLDVRANYNGAKNSPYHHHFLFEITIMIANNSDGYCYTQFLDKRNQVMRRPWPSQESRRRSAS